MSSEIIDKSIKRDFYKSKYLKVTMVVVIDHENTKDNGNMISEYVWTDETGGMNRTLRINAMGYIVISANSSKSGKCGIAIAEGGLYKILRAFDKMKKLIDPDNEDDDPYYEDDTGMLALYSDKVRIFTTYTNTKKTSALIMKPSVLVDDDEYQKGVEAVTMNIGPHNELHTIPMEEFFTLKRILEGVNFFDYTQNMITTYMVYKEKMKSEQVVFRRNYVDKTRNVFLPPLTEEEKAQKTEHSETVTGVLPQKKTDDFFGIEGGELVNGRIEGI